MLADLSRRRAGALLLVLATALPLVVAAVQARHELSPEGIGIDDAHIFLRYGRNLAHGQGFVWNPGGERVEGVTSILWTLTAAAAYLVVDNPNDLLFGVALAMVALALAFWVAVVFGPLAGETESPARWPVALGALALGLDLAAHPSFAIWTAASLMDGGVWCATLLAAATTLALAVRPRAGTGTIAAAALAQVALALARPEAMVAGPGLIVAAALASRGRIRRWLAPAAAALATQGALLVWRLATFGWPLPNTYYAKVGAAVGPRLAAGVAYLRDAAGHDPGLRALWPLAVIVLAVVVFDRLRRGASKLPAQVAPALALAAAGTLLAPLFVLFEGGDFFAGFRTLVQMRPFAASLLLLTAAAAFRLRWRPAHAQAVAALLVALAAVPSYAAGEARWGRLVPTTRHYLDFAVARGGLAVAATLDRLFASAPHAPTIGVLGAGALPLAYRGPSRDLLGLSDVEIAHATRRRRGIHGHAAFSAVPFFAAPPELLLVGPPECMGRPAEHTERRIRFRELLANLDLDPRFGQLYRLVRLRDPKTGQPALCCYARADWLDAGADGLPWDPAPVPPRPPAPGGAGPTGRLGGR